MSDTKTWNGRILTKREQRFRDDRRCIACGIKVTVLINEKNKNEYWPFECTDCARTRLDTGKLQRITREQEINPSRNLRLKYRRLLGYQAKDID
jgi:hypothetical protein